MKVLTLVALSVAVALGQSVSLSIVSIGPLPFIENANVTVQWTVTNGTVGNKDWISAWWAPFQATYLSYRNVTTATGTATFHLINARHGFYFRYFRGDTIVAQSETVHPEGSYPTQIRLSFVENMTDYIRVSWTSNRTLSNIVKYGTSSSALRHVAQATADTYTHSDLNQRIRMPNIPIITKPLPHLDNFKMKCDTQLPNCWDDLTSCKLYVDPGVFHSALLGPLKPDTDYYFSVGEANGYLSSVRRFHSRVPAGAVPRSGHLSVLYVADGGVGTPSPEERGGARDNDPPANGANFVWEVISKDPQTAHDHAAILNGDISYARGWPWIWELFHSQSSHGVFDRLPTMAQFGNHEFDFARNPFKLCDGVDSGGEAGIVAGKRFFIDIHKPWYTHAMGPLLLISFSSEHTVDPQVAWAREQLVNVDRSVTPWIVAFMHRPFFTSNWYGNIELHTEFLKYAELFTEFGVDMVLAGHDHYYERLCRISSAACNTWGFRDVWTTYPDVYPHNASCYYPGGSQFALDYLECRTACATVAGCTGVTWDKLALQCSLLTCPFNAEMQFDSNQDVDTMQMEKQPGEAPLYIVDGSAGAEFSPMWTIPNPQTVYKDFRKWGYSRFHVNTTHLHWLHYHLDGKVADEVTLTKP